MGSWGYLIVGLVAAACGAVLITQANGEDVVAMVGYAMTTVGSVMVSIGVIAIGVKVGNEETRRR